MNPFLYDFNEAEENLREAIWVYKGALEKLQGNCPHTLVTEVGMGEHSHFFPTQKPRRICETCGFEEESKHHFNAFEILTTDRPKIINSRDEFYKLRKNLNAVI